jgi:hypothetical protein
MTTNPSTLAAAKHLNSLLQKGVKKFYLKAFMKRLDIQHDKLEQELSPQQTQFSESMGAQKGVSGLLPGMKSTMKLKESLKAQEQSSLYQSKMERLYAPLGASIQKSPTRRKLEEIRQSKADLMNESKVRSLIFRVEEEYAV